MANGSSLRRERREVGSSWLGHSDTETWFTLPQRRHLFPRNTTVADLFAYKSTSICNLTYQFITLGKKIYERKFDSRFLSCIVAKKKMTPTQFWE